MTASTRHESAKIYMFPVRRRPPLAFKRDDIRHDPRETQPVPPIDTDAWYHQAAMQDKPDPHKG
ncbi:DUF2735 domain-containing protein [Labrys neptuniae]